MGKGLLVLIVVVALYLIVAALPRLGRGEKDEAADGHEEEEASPPDMDESFLDAARKGDRKAVDAVVVHSPADLVLLRSLLYSSKIENYARNDHVSALLPGVGIAGLTSVAISVFEDDYEAACELVGEYLEEKKKGREEGSSGAGDRIRNVGEFIVAGRFVSSGEDSTDPRIIPLPRR